MEGHHRRRQDLVRGNTKQGVDCENRDHWRTYGRPIRPWPLNVSHILQRNLNGHYTKIHLNSKQKITTKLEKLCFIVTLPHNTICYLSFHLASKFNTYKSSPTSDSVFRSLLEIRPWLGTSVLQTPWDCPLILVLRSAHDQNAEDVERKENRNGVSHSPVDQRIWRSNVSSSMQRG